MAVLSHAQAHRADYNPLIPNCQPFPPKRGQNWPQLYYVTLSYASFTSQGSGLWVGGPLGVYNCIMVLLVRSTISPIFHTLFFLSSLSTAGAH